MCEFGGPATPLWYGYAMKLFRVLLVLVSAVVLSACGGKQTPESAASNSEAPKKTEAVAGELAPAPFTAEQIRAATAVGRTYRFEVNLGGEIQEVEMRFVEVSDASCTIEQTYFDASGKPKSEPTRSEQTWQDLVGHAAYPKAGTRITERRVETPAGSWDALVYEVRETKQGKEWLTVAYFARDLPGAPVRHEVSVGGQPLSVMILKKHTPGEQATPASAD